MLFKHFLLLVVEILGTYNLVLVLFEEFLIRHLFGIRIQLYVSDDHVLARGIQGNGMGAGGEVEFKRIDGVAQPVTQIIGFPAENLGTDGTDVIPVDIVVKVPIGIAVIIGILGQLIFPHTREIQVTRLGEGELSVDKHHTLDGRVGAGGVVVADPHGVAGILGDFDRPADLAGVRREEHIVVALPFRIADRIHRLIARSLFHLDIRRRPLRIVVLAVQDDRGLCIRDVLVL